MEISELDLPKQLQDRVARRVKTLRPAQEKAVNAGLLKGRSLLVCTPTASGKTLIAELAAMKLIFEKDRKAVYIAPLKALAGEKWKEFKLNYPELKMSYSAGDMDGDDRYLASSDLIFTTSEKLDSLIRHRSPWLREIGVIIIDEIHLLNDPGRGPTLEILITLLRSMLPAAQIVGLSATIGNPRQLSDWLGAELVEDGWRPVKLQKGIHSDGTIEFFDVP